MWSAAEHRIQQGSYASTQGAHQMPHTTAIIYLQGLPIMSKTDNTLRCAYLSQVLWKHMTQWENWDEHVADTIWWEAHKCALNCLEKMDKTRIHSFTDAYQPTKNYMTRTQNTPPHAHSAWPQKQIPACLHANTKATANYAGSYVETWWKHSTSMIRMHTSRNACSSDSYKHYREATWL